MSGFNFDTQYPRDLVSGSIASGATTTVSTTEVRVNYIYVSGAADIQDGSGTALFSTAGEVVLPAQRYKDGLKIHNSGGLAIQCAVGVFSL